MVEMQGDEMTRYVRCVEVYLFLLVVKSFIVQSKFVILCDYENNT